MNKKLLRIIKGLCIAAVVISAVVFIIYSFGWFAVTKQIEAHINSINKQKLITITGELPRFGGYPLVPKANFSGTISHESSLVIGTPNILYSGFPTVGQIQTLEAPNGLKISADFLERNLNFDYAYLQLRIPNSLPMSGEIEDIRHWQRSNSQFIINQIVLKSGQIYARGDGTLSLDENLQLAANINARVVGMDIMFDEMAKEQGEKSVILARNFFNMMSKIDEKTGEKYFETTLKIEKQGVYFGPMRISGLPKLIWK
jgi:hypothetical protein